MKPVVVFDVESAGLHGEGFAVGAVVVDVEAGECLDEFYAACKGWLTSGTEANREWLRANLPELEYTHLLALDVRNAFWAFWRRWAEQGALLASDCGWPVEANFLSACVADVPAERQWQGPYPLLDLAPIIWAAGGDPLATTERQVNELPIHHPLADARQSARQLIEWKRKAGAQG